MLALVAAVALVKGFNLDVRGVLTIGAVPAGLPSLRWPVVSSGELEGLAPAAIGLALVSFTSGMVTARSFAARNRYEIDVDRELIALGLCNISASLSQGFAVTGADSRTAVNDAMGGKSQVTGLVAAATMTMVLLWLTGPLQYLPVCALGAVMMSAAWGLFDWKAMVHLSRIREGELIVCVAAMLGVVASARCRAFCSRSACRWWSCSSARRGRPTRCLDASKGCPASTTWRDTKARRRFPAWCSTASTRR